MHDPIDTAERWCARAEEARTLAEIMTDPDAKRAMLRVAQNYDRLALKAIEKSRKSAA